MKTITWLGVNTTWDTVVKGHIIGKVENHCSVILGILMEDVLELETWLDGQEQVLLLQRTCVHCLAVTSQLTAPRDTTPSSSLHGHHTYLWIATHRHTNVCIWNKSFFKNLKGRWACHLLPLLWITKPQAQSKVKVWGQFGGTLTAPTVAQLGRLSRPGCVSLSFPVYSSSHIGCLWALKEIRKSCPGNLPWK